MDKAASVLVIKLFQLLDLHDPAGQANGMGPPCGRIPVLATLVWDCSALKETFLNCDVGGEKPSSTGCSLLLRLP